MPVGVFFFFVLVSNRCEDYAMFLALFVFLESQAV